WRQVRGHLIADSCHRGSQGSLQRSCGMRAQGTEATLSGRRAKRGWRRRSVVEELERRELLTATILGRYTFYGNSAFDNGTSVGAAIATDKSPLLPGQTASFANYTSCVRGVNAIAVDVANLPAAAPTGADFVLRAGNAGDPSTWGTVSQGVTYSVQRGAGTG